MKKFIGMALVILVLTSSVSAEDKGAIHNSPVALWAMAGAAIAAVLGRNVKSVPKQLGIVFGGSLVGAAAHPGIIDKSRDMYIIYQSIKESK